MNIVKTVIKLPKKYLILGVAVILISGLFITQRNKNSSSPQFVQVQRADLKQEISASGILTGKNNSDLHFRGSGKLAYINVKAGDSVTQGEVIAGLDAQDLNSNLAQAQNNLRSAQVNLEKTLDDIHLFQYGNGGFPNVGSPSETETQKQARMNAEVARDNAVEAVNAAQIAYQNDVITSPIDGIVTRANPLPGQVVSPGDLIAQVVDFSQIVFSADVDEADISKVSLGQKAEVTLNAYGDKIFQGKVIEITPETRTTSNGATVVTVKISLDNSPVKTIAGLNGQVNIITSEKDNALDVPQDALLNSNTVLVKTPTAIQTRTVTTGFQTDTEVEVTSGLKEGDQVVTNPQVVSKTLGSQNLFSRIFKR